MTESTPQSPQASFPRRLGAGILAGAFIGVLWGGGESLARLLYYHLSDQVGIRALPELSALDWVRIVILSGLEYAAVGAVVGLFSMLVLAPLLGLVFRRQDAEWAGFVAPRFAMWTAILFCNLYWWSRFVIDFARSERFYSPKRLLLAAAFALIAMAAAAWIVRRLRDSHERLSTARTVSVAAVVLLGAMSLLAERATLAEQPDKEDAIGKYNVVLFVVDALRASQLHCYGYERETTPRIDELAAEGVLFERAIVQAPYTWTSFGTLFTGKYPRHHGLMKMDPTIKFNPQANATIQTILDETGYRTGAFLTGMLSNASGLIDGFETYFESMVGRDPVRRSSVWSFYRSELVLRAVYNKVRQAVSPTLVADEAADWIRENKDSRFLSVVHLYPTHTPYDPPDEYDIFSPDYTGPLDKFTHEHSVLLATGQWDLSEEDHQRIIDLYDGGLLFADAMIGGIVDVLEEEGILDETIVVITSDHGEELGEHDKWEHNWMYNTNQLVPLIFRMPDGLGAGTRVDVPVEYTDIVPTLLDLVDMPHDRDWDGDGVDGFDGETLRPWFEGQRPKEDDFGICENHYYLSVQNKDWKLVKSKEYVPGDLPRLYHLATDPWEMKNVYDTSPPELDELIDKWDEYNAIQPRKQETMPVDPINMELLAELGYADSGFTHGVSEREGVSKDLQRRIGAVHAACDCGNVCTNEEHEAFCDCRTRCADPVHKPKPEQR